MAIDITIDQKGLARFSRFGQQLQKQLPFATSVAMNALAQGVKSIPGSDTYNIRTALVGASKGYFNKPTPFIAKGWRATRAKKSDLQVIIHPEEKRVKYLKAHFTGGARTYKDYEARLLAGSGLSTQALIPSYVKRNPAGNVTRGTLGKIIGAEATRGPGSVFIGKPFGGNRGTGVYERTAQGSLKPLFVAQPRAYYTGGFPLEQTAWTVYSRRFNGYLYAALEQALASAK